MHTRSLACRTTRPAQARRRTSTGHPIRRPIASALIALAACALGATAKAEVHVFSDRGAFLAATVTTITETFDTQNADRPFHTVAADLGAFSLSMTPGASEVYNFVDVPPLMTSATSVNGSAHLVVFTDAGVDLTFQFDQAFTAFGADFKGINDEFERTQFSVDGQVVAIPGEPVNLQLTFFGFTSDTPFTSLTFHGVRNDIYGIDDVSLGYASRVPAIPEPGSLAMLSLGLCGVAVARRRASRRTDDNPTVS